MRQREFITALGGAVAWPLVAARAQRSEIVKRIGILSIAIGVAGSAAAGPFEDGTAAARVGDYETAMRLLRPLADGGDSQAQTLLAHLYWVIIPPDYAAAASWYGKAAERGNAFAQDRLAYQYANGLGVTQDYAAAATWYRKAADQGQPDAQTSLGFQYANGLGVPQDYVTAHMWFSLASAKGNRDAVRDRDRIATLMTPEQIAEAQKRAREWLPASRSTR
jgi:TPR repeat protein